MTKRLLDFIKQDCWSWVCSSILSGESSLSDQNEQGVSARDLILEKINLPSDYEIFDFHFSWTPTQQLISEANCEKGTDVVKKLDLLLELGADPLVECEQRGNLINLYLKGLKQNQGSWVLLKKLVKLGIDIHSSGKVAIGFDKEKNMPIYTDQFSTLDVIEKKFGEKIASRCEAIYNKMKEKGQRKADGTYKEYKEKKYKWAERRKNQYLRERESGIVIIHENLPTHPYITSSPQEPLLENDIDKEQAIKWINQHAEQDRSNARRLMSQIKCVSYNEFVEKLIKTVNQFNEYIMSRSENDRNYAILLMKEKFKSDAWVVSHTLPHLRHAPDLITDGIKREDYSQNQDQNIKHLVIIDDAAYSGNDMTTKIERITNQIQLFEAIFLNAKIHVILPYVTERAKKRLENLGVRLYYSEIMPALDVEGYCGATGVYFQHKKPESGVSNPRCIIDGSFSAPTKAPYKEDYHEFVQQQKNNTRMKA